MLSNMIYICACIVAAVDLHLGYAYCFLQEPYDLDSNLSPNNHHLKDEEIQVLDRPAEI